MREHTSLSGHTTLPTTVQDVGSGISDVGTRNKKNTRGLGFLFLIYKDKF